MSFGSKGIPSIAGFIGKPLGKLFGSLLTLPLWHTGLEAEGMNIAGVQYSDPVRIFHNVESDRSTPSQLDVLAKQPKPSSTDMAGEVPV
jgi:hypothetical protein